MGLFGFGKKKYEKNVTRDKEFLRSYSIKCNGLTQYLEGHENILKELNTLKDDFQYTMPSVKPEAKKVEKDIIANFDNLTNLLSQTDWDENEVLTTIRNLRRLVNEIGSMR